MTGSFSIWHWLIVLLVIGFAIWLIVRSRRTGVPGAPLSGIGGWLAWLAFVLCVGLVGGAVEVLTGALDYFSGQNQAAPHQLVIFGLATLAAYIGALLWAIVALFQKRRAFRRAFLILWVTQALAQLSALTWMTVPGVTFAMIFPAEELGKNIGSVIGLGLWYWYVSVSVRVQNTMVN